MRSQIAPLLIISPPHIMRYICMMKRIAASLSIGILAAILSLHLAVNGTAGDLAWPLCGARAVLSHTDPYDCPRFAGGKYWPTNPMTTVLVALPFAWLPADIAGLLIFSLSSGILAYGLIREGRYWRLLLFLSPSYWFALRLVQWSPLLSAAALLPSLLPLWIIKPHIGLPVALTGRWTHMTLLVTLLFGVSTLAIYPLWPVRWLHTIGGFPGFVPLLTPAGALLLFGLRHWRDRDMRLLFFMACVPQQIFYDALVLFTLPRTPRALLALIIISWPAVFFAPNQWWEVALLYVPTLYICANKINECHRRSGSQLVVVDADIGNSQGERLRSNELPGPSI